MISKRELYLLNRAMAGDASKHLRVLPKDADIFKLLLALDITYALLEEDVPVSNDVIYRYLNTRFKNNVKSKLDTLMLTEPTSSMLLSSRFIDTHLDYINPRLRLMGLEPLKNHSESNWNKWMRGGRSMGKSAAFAAQYGAAQSLIPTLLDRQLMANAANTASTPNPSDQADAMAAAVHNMLNTQRLYSPKQLANIHKVPED